MKNCSAKKNSVTKQAYGKTRIGDVSWLFLLMEDVFKHEWVKRYPPKRTRFVQHAKAEWGRIINGFSRDELQHAVNCAYRASNLPPSALDFWKILESKRIKDRYNARKRVDRKPPNRTLGAEMLKATKEFLHNPNTKNSEKP